MATMYMDDTEYLDIHEELSPYQDVLSYLCRIEANGDLKRFFKGANAGGRWFFQILSTEFVSELAQVLNTVCEHSPGPVLEIMSGDGQLAKFLAPHLTREIIATDAKDGRYNIAYPKWVETMDAKEAVKHYQPAITLVSWEPFLSMVGMELVESGAPIAWIGQIGKCGHPELFDHDHVKMNSRYALGKFDSFISREFNTDVYLFNVGDIL